MIARHPLLSQSLVRIARLAPALAALIEARADANEFRIDPWEFALSLDALYRVGLTEVDIRWLISSGLIEQAAEKTPLGAEKRDFQPIAGRVITNQSCFLLTQAGSQLAEQVAAPGTPVANPPNPHRSETLLPSWNAKTRELNVGAFLVKRFRTPAECQELVLDAFESEKWVERVRNPLPKDAFVDPIHQLRDTIRRLNKKQQNAKIFFSRDGTGDGICWRIL
jgi:hypothetical protein